MIGSALPTALTVAMIANGSVGSLFREMRKRPTAVPAATGVNETCVHFVPPVPMSVGPQLDTQAIGPSMRLTVTPYAGAVPSFNATSVDGDVVKTLVVGK